MKTLKVVLSILAFSLVLSSPAVFAQILTESYGQGVFANSGEPIKIVVDASLAIKEINSPYVMFIVYLASGQEGQNIVVDRNGIALIYNGQEYKMPSVKELRQNYHVRSATPTFIRFQARKDWLQPGFAFINSLKTRISSPHKA